MCAALTANSTKFSCNAHTYGSIAPEIAKHASRAFPKGSKTGPRAALGLLRFGFAIASPRNDAIPDDSRDGHLPCEEQRKCASNMHWKLVILC